MTDSTEHAGPEVPDLLDAAALPVLGMSGAFLLAVFLGGALGTLARYLLDTAIPNAPTHFPIATLLINLSGSLLIGLVIPLTEHHAEQRPSPIAALLRPFLVVGILGGWTTYSTLAVDSVHLFQFGHSPIALAYLAATLFGGLAAVLIGHAFGRRLVPT